MDIKWQEYGMQRKDYVEKLATRSKTDASNRFVGIINPYFDTNVDYIHYNI